MELDDIFGKLPEHKQKPINTGAGTSNGPGISAEELEIASEVAEEEKSVSEILEESKIVENELEEEIADEGQSETDNQSAENSGANIPDDEPSDTKRTVKEILDEKVKLYRVFISGRLFLSMIDQVVPLVIVKGGQLVKLIDKNKDWHSIQMTDEQIDELEEIADEIVDYIFSNLHPLAQFALSIGTIYAGNLGNLADKQLTERDVLKAVTNDSQENT